MLPPHLFAPDLVQKGRIDWQHFSRVSIPSKKKNQYASIYETTIDLSFFGISARPRSKRPHRLATFLKCQPAIQSTTRNNHRSEFLRIIARSRSKRPRRLATFLKSQLAIQVVTRNICKADFLRIIASIH